MRTLSSLWPEEAQVANRIHKLKEKVIQFGSGRFLRTFVDDFIDSANRQGIFNGRIVLVQSTSHETVKNLRLQDGLYTVWLEGLKEGHTIEKQHVISSISRALTSDQDWPEILTIAKTEDLQLVVSNTTEVGINFDGKDQIDAKPPQSFPGKSAVFLYERYRHFSGSPESGLTILPCELITDNGNRLREIILQLAQHWGLELGFSKWIERSNQFSNSLVDRIVTGRPTPGRVEQYWKRLGYRDELISVGEPYALWAIEGYKSLSDQLGFPKCQTEIIIKPDIMPYRKRKIRLLNGAHTSSASLGFLCGYDTVLEIMKSPLLSSFVETLIRREISPGLDLDNAETECFVDQVLDRFRNPFLRHQLLDITFQSTLKWRLRVLPSILNFQQKTGQLPPRLMLGFASYLLFMRSIEQKDGKFFGHRKDSPYLILDDEALYFHQVWKEVTNNNRSDLLPLVDQICSETRLWGNDLTLLPGFVEVVLDSLSDPQQQLERLTK